MKHAVRALALLVIVATPAYAGTIVTPEPATIGLVATGLGALGLAAWIKGKRKP